jgi:hypothetical protein
MMKSAQRIGFGPIRSSLEAYLMLPSLNPETIGVVRQLLNDFAFGSDVWSVMADAVKVLDPLESFHGQLCKVSVCFVCLLVFFLVWFF